MIKVLVVDDSELFRTLFRGVLEAAGCEVLTASDGKDALDIIVKQQVKVLISDWEMPRVTGLELCTRLRAECLPWYVYTILVTSRDTAEDRVAGLAAGADDFIVKPVNHAELVQRVRVAERLLSMETRDIAIFAMAKLAESRDPETGAHLERVRCYARVLAQDLAANGPRAAEIDAEFIRLIYLTSPLHDIGKVGIPDYVLLNPGRLNDREFEIMKTHTRLGAATLEAALEAFPGVRFLMMGRDIAATHHERWNGKGYPEGLRGEQIPLSGRIVAVADVYDALTSKRVYKGAFTHDIAKSMIAAESGGHFDPEVVAAFLRREQQFLHIYDRYSESREPSRAGRGVA